MKNKKGAEGPVMLFITLAVILGAAFVIALITGLTNVIFDEVTPVINDLGEVSGTGTIGDNLTENANLVITPLGTMINSANWLMGVMYALVLILVFVLAFSIRITGQKYLIVFFFLLSILLLFFSISISNGYEDLSSGNDVVANSLQQQTLMTWLIINSPMINVIVLLIAGVIMMTGQPEAFA